MLALDLGVFHRKAHVVSVKEALAWSAVWIAMALSFAVFVYFAYDGQWFGLGTMVDAVDGLTNGGPTATEKYLTGYAVEKSLSVDNIFVIAMIFGFFAVPPLYQHRVLFWGTLGALVLRGAMIGVGAKLIAEFHWILYLFAVFLILTAIKMLFLKTDHTGPNKNIVVRLTRRLFPVTARFHGEHFVVRAGAPASYESEIPGLRSLYFALAGMVKKFRYLKVSLALVLMVVGVKMLLAKWLKLALGKHFNLYLLTVVLSILAAGVAASVLAERRRTSRLL